MSTDRSTSTERTWLKARAPSNIRADRYRPTDSGSLTMSTMLCYSGSILMSANKYNNNEDDDDDDDEDNNNNTINDNKASFSAPKLMHTLQWT